jgi:transcription-repair coupling factor (superfamily II helicase)
MQTIASWIKPNEKQSIRIKGISGSQDAVLSAAIFQLNHQNHLFILHEKEEAAYFVNDLQNLLPDREILLFPTSYKRPYEFEEVENANVLMRAEVLNRINHKSSNGELIVTYPEALTEKVINKRSLLNNTFSVQEGEKLDTEFLGELLINFDFEKADFVYEPGQFAIRGGVMDIFSYANDYPVRLELFGDEVESIRKFDPNTQLSKDGLKQVNIIPNIQTKLIEEKRDSFFEFLPKNTKIWIKDLEFTQDVIGKYFDKSTESFDTILEESGNTKIVLSPDELFENSESFNSYLQKFTLIEFGNRFSLNCNHELTLNSSIQPSFNKDFDLLSEDLLRHQSDGFLNTILGESPSQLQRLESIFAEIAPELDVRSIHCGLRQGFVDLDMKLLCYTDHQVFGRFYRYKVKEKQSKSRALTLKELKTLQTGDYVVHIDYGIGRFAGLEKIEVNGNEQEALRLIYKDDDLLYVSIHSLHKISRYTGKEGTPPSISKLGSPEWENKKRKVKKKVKELAFDLIQLYAKRKAAPGFSFSQDSFLQAELESSFIYEDTPDQAKSTADVKADMEKSYPMDRLVCGDVGFGKTEVAIRAAFKACSDGKQVAVLVPTTILAMQHYRSFKERLATFPISIDYVNRFRTSKQTKDIVERLAKGEINILIGTHKIVNKDIKWKDLGLLVIDEEQKFGVGVKEKLKNLKVNVDTLTLTATPIPRTLHFSLMGARDLSVIQSPPPNRQPVSTQTATFNESIIRDAISFELRRGGQVFFVHNRVKDIEEIANIIMKLVPDARVGVAHGQMEGSRLERVMLRFIEGEYDILVSTNIIESGLDIPNANTIIINHAHMFGLSDLHQMRGRVGRSNKKAFCYLLAPPTIGLTGEARKRLRTLEEFSELGDGFKVAMRDLDIRGAGNLLGAEQSGFVSDIGFDTYHKILDEAVGELKENEFKALFETEDLEDRFKSLVQDCTLETDFELLIPDDYVENISERLSLYSDLDNLKDEQELSIFRDQMRDRFGKIPEPVEDLFKSVRLRWVAQRLGFEKVTLKNEALKGHFLKEDNEAYFNSNVFGSVIAFVQKNHKICRMREARSGPILIVDHINSIDKAITILKDIEPETIQEAI